MDPLSITVSVATLISTCGRICWELKKLKDASQMADSKLNSIVGEVECFKRLLHQMAATMQSINADESMQDTGHLGNHLRSISVCIADGISLLGRLHETLRSVGKSSRVLDGVRKHFRLMSASDEISVYQGQIKSYRDTIQLSMQAVILWNQVSIRTSTEKIPLSLNRLCKDIKGLARNMNDRVQYMEQNVAPTIAYADELKRLQNQRKCMRAAAEVVSSASTNVGSNTLPSTSAPSDFNDVLPLNPSESMLRWFSEAVPSVYEETDVAAEPVHFRNVNVNVCAVPGIADGGEIASIAFSTHMVEDSDSDGEMETEIVQLQLAKGKTELLSGNFEAAEKMLRNGLTRLNHHRSRHFGTDLKLSVSQALLDTYTRQEKWEEAKDVILERLATLSGHSFEKSDRYLDEALSLADVLLRLGDVVQARIYAKKCVKAYREQGPLGSQGLARALNLMIAVCRSENNTVDEEAFQLLLSHSEGQDPRLSTEASDPSTSSECSELSQRQILGSGSQVQVPQFSSYLGALADPYEMLWDGESPSITSDGSGEAATQELNEAQTHLAVLFEGNNPAEQRSSTPSNDVSAITASSSLQNAVPDPGLDWQEGYILASFQHNCSGNTEASNPAHSSEGLVTRFVSLDEVYPSPWRAFETTLRTRFNKYDGCPIVDVETNSQMLSCETTKFQHRKRVKDDTEMYQLAVSFQERVSLDAFYEIEETDEPLGAFLGDSDTETQHERGVDQVRDTTQPTDMADMTICADISDGSALSALATPAPLRSLFSSSEDSEQEYPESIPDSSPADSLPTIPTTVNSPAMTNVLDRITVIVLGEPLCGKTSLIWRFLQNEFPIKPHMTMRAVPCIANVHADSIEGSQVELIIWDTPSLGTDRCFEDIKTIRNVQCVVLCFSVNDPDLIANIDNHWLREIHEHIPKTPIVLAALQKDLRDGARSAVDFRSMKDRFCSFLMGDQLRDRIGAVQYCECSAVTGAGVEEVFRLAASEGMKQKRMKRSKRT